MLVAKNQARGRVMKTKKLSFWNAVSNAISIVALTVLTAIFYVYSAKRGSNWAHVSHFQHQPIWVEKIDWIIMRSPHER